MMLITPRQGIHAMDRGICPGLILIVEDDNKIAALVALYLEREGFTTLITADGSQALELARRHQARLVKEVIEAHGGQVGVESARTETRVWLTLPV
jgi:CheY-like chemotaxis protein